MNQTNSLAKGVHYFAVFLAALGLIVAVFAVTGKTSHAIAGSSTAFGDVTLILNNRETSGPGFTFPNIGNVDQLLSQGNWHGNSQTPRLLLSDNLHAGTFKMRYILNQRGVPQYDSFTAKNTGGQPFELMVTSENETILPTRPRDNSKLLVCLDQLCDANIFFPDSTFAPPFSLGVLQPGTSATHKVGLMLAADASWAEWDNTIQQSRLFFQAVASN